MTLPSVIFQQTSAPPNLWTGVGGLRREGSAANWGQTKPGVSGETPDNGPRDDGGPRRRILRFTVAAAK